jgi:hypothetical protein
LGGSGEFSERPAALEPDFNFDLTPPLFELSYDEFGPRRLMWWSD